MTLRMRVVEAGARAIFYSGERTKNLIWDSINDDQRRYYLQLSRDALDGHLDCLAGNADEWADYPAEADPIVVAHREIIARKLVNALREDR